MVETIVYFFIMSMLMLLISSLVMNIFNARKQLQASHIVHNDARFIINFLNNRVHNVDVIDDVSPAPEQLHFYQMPDIRFSLAIEGADLAYRQTEDSGSGFPDQSSIEPIIINSDNVEVINFVLTPISDSHGNANQGVDISFTLRTGNVDDIYGYSQITFNTFMSIR
ncbi:hypothetical protein K8R42_00505 [bacterium]|nr:hypothetical protein [bacterium]